MTKKFDIVGSLNPDIEFIHADLSTIKGGYGVIDSNKVYILPQQNKPIKIVYEELLCPVLLQLGGNYRCEHSKSKVEDDNFTLYCEKGGCDITVKMK